jgi:hypothetical protein
LTKPGRVVQTIIEQVDSRKRETGKVYNRLPELALQEDLEKEIPEVDAWLGT